MHSDSHAEHWQFATSRFMAIQCDIFAPIIRGELIDLNIQTL
jgi:hypothetical protein